MHCCCVIRQSYLRLDFHLSFWYCEIHINIENICPQPDEAMMEDFEIRQPNYLSYVSGGESDTEAESVTDEPKRFEDFDDRYVF